MRTRKPSPATVISLISLFIALSGVAWAATKLSKDSVKSKHIKDGQVKGKDVADDGLTGADILESSLQGVSGSVGPQGPPGQPGPPGPALGSEAWHEIGAAGEPGFNNTGFCRWKNFDANHQSAAFLRDGAGFVHLKGLVDADDFGGSDCNFVPTSDKLIFELPPGYRPARRSVHTTLANNVLARVNIEGPAAFSIPAGGVSVDTSVAEADAEQFLSLDGISFRCAPAGANGCP